MWLKQKCLYITIGFFLMPACIVFPLSREKHFKSSSQQNQTRPSKADVVESTTPPKRGGRVKKEEAIFELTESIKFADGTEIFTVGKYDIKDLRELPIHMGGNETDGVTLTKQETDKIHVRTCREYDSAVEQGYFPYTTYDITMKSFFKYPCGLLNIFHTAKYPEQSFIVSPTEGILNLELLPLSFFPVLSDFEQTYGFNIKNVTYQEQVEKGLLEVTDMGQNWMSCEIEGLTQHLTEVARADFNGDGIEDILLSEAVYATRGSFRTYKITILTKKSLDGKYEKYNRMV